MTTITDGFRICLSLYDTHKISLIRDIVTNQNINFIEYIDKELSYMGFTDIKTRSEFHKILDLLDIC
jgi:hypothetical protein